MGRPKEPTDTPTANENLVYLLMELERVLNTGNVQNERTKPKLDRI